MPWTIFRKVIRNYWILGLLGFRTIELLGIRTIGPSDYWVFGLSGLQTIGPSDLRSIGPTPQIGGSLDVGKQ